MKKFDVIGLKHYYFFIGKMTSLGNKTMQNLTTEKPKKKMGRPLKEKHGVTMWIPAELADTVKLLIQATRQANQKQAKQ
jgi:hypothetical protein